MSNLLSLINDTSHLVWVRSLEFHSHSVCNNWIWACAAADEARWWEAMKMSWKHSPKLKADYFKLGKFFSSKVVNEMPARQSWKDLRRHQPAKSEIKTRGKQIRRRLLCRHFSPSNYVVCRLMNFSNFLKKKTNIKEKSQRCLEKCEEIMTA